MKFTSIVTVVLFCFGLMLFVGVFDDKFISKWPQMAFNSIVRGLCLGCFLSWLEFEFASV